MLPDGQGHQEQGEGGEHQGCAEDGADPDLLVDLLVLGAAEDGQQGHDGLGQGGADGREKGAGDPFRDLQALAQVLEGVDEDLGGDEDQDEEEQEFQGEQGDGRGRGRALILPVQRLGL